jgi:hypothetical protein
MTTFAEKVIAFNRRLRYTGELPDGFQVINPFLDNPETLTVMATFYRKYYNDDGKRRFLAGINPGRLGAGVTGIPFTDTKRLESACGIVMQSAHTHEISSLFVYDMIEAYGGPARFYSDDPALFEAVKGFMVQSLKQHIELGLDTSEVFVLGKKNAEYIGRLNAEERLFGKLTVLEHPRYIQQYRSRERKAYIDKYLRAFHGE